MSIISKIAQIFKLRPQSSSAISAQGEMEVLSASGKLNYHNGTTASPQVTEAHSAAFTNKTYDADGTGNVLSNISNGNIKAAAAIARSKFATGTINRVVVNDGATGAMSDAAAITASRALASDANGIPTHSVTTATELGYVSGVTSAIQTQINTIATTNSSDQLSNIGLASSVGSNALTVALKTASGADPSGGSPVTIGTRNSTAGTGQFNSRTVTGALSIVISSGSTLGFVSGSRAQYLYVYAIDNAGTIELALSHSKTWDNGSLITTTVLAGGGADDSGTLIYSTTARANVACRLIGRIKFTLATAGTWDEAGDEISLVPFDNVVPRSEVTVDTGNGNGAVNTKIRRFTNTRKNLGTAITYSDNANGGSAFTINEDGVYAISYSDQRAAGGFDIGISVNSANGATSIDSLTYANGKRAKAEVSAANVTGFVSWCGNLLVGDIVTPQGDGTADVSTDVCMWTIVKVSP